MYFIDNNSGNSEKYVNMDYNFSVSFENKKISRQEFMNKSYLTLKTWPTLQFLSSAICCNAYTDISYEKACLVRLYVVNLVQFSVSARSIKNAKVQRTHVETLCIPILFHIHICLMFIIMTMKTAVVMNA
jgi:hypothetical protein